MSKKNGKEPGFINIGYLFTRFLVVMIYAFVIGGIGFALGFFGPMLLMHLGIIGDSGQPPLLGIFITGPLGFVIGLAIGIARELVKIKS